VTDQTRAECSAVRPIVAQLTERWRTKSGSTAIIRALDHDTYGTLSLTMQRIGAAIQECGVTRGKLAACTAKDPTVLLLSVLGVWQAGAAAMLVPHDLGSVELDRLRAALPCDFTVGEGGDEVTDQSYVSYRPIACDIGGAGRRVTLYEHPRAATGGPRVTPDVAAVFLTSGTTGARKPVLQDDRRLIATCRALQRAHRGFFDLRSIATLAAVASTVRLYGPRLIRFTRPQRWYTPIDLRSISGFTFALNALWGGHQLVLVSARTPRNILELIETQRVGVLAVTPVQAELVLRAARGRPARNSLVVVGIGGAPFSPAMAADLERTLRCPVVTGYGSTETAGGVTATLPHQRRQLMAGTAGYPMPGVHLQCVDDAGHDVGRGVDGLIRCSLEAASASGELEWIETGDIGRIETDGSLTVLGRADDQILIADRRVSPIAVEAVISALPEVDDVAVLGAPGQRGHDELWAFFVPRGGLPASKEVWDVLQASIRAELQTTLPAWMIPTHLRTISAMPRTASGQVARAALLAELGDRRDLEGGGITVPVQQSHH